MYECRMKEKAVFDSLSLFFLPLCLSHCPLFDAVLIIKVFFSSLSSPPTSSLYYEEQIPTDWLLFPLSCSANMACVRACVRANWFAHLRYYYARIRSYAKSASTVCPLRGKLIQQWATTTRTTTAKGSGKTFVCTTLPKSRDCCCSSILSLSLSHSLSLSPL